MSYKMKPDPPLTNGNFKSKIERVKTATKKYVDEVKKQKIDLFKVSLFGEGSGKGLDLSKTISYNPAEKEAVKKIQNVTQRINKAKSKLNKK